MTINEILLSRPKADESSEWARLLLNAASDLERDNVWLRHCENISTEKICALVFKNAELDSVNERLLEIKRYAQELRLNLASMPQATQAVCDHNGALTGLRDALAKDGTP